MCFARRESLKRISRDTYEETGGMLIFFLQNDSREAVTNIKHAKCKTLSAIDIFCILKLQCHDKMCAT